MELDWLKRNLIRRMGLRAMYLKPDNMVPWRTIRALSLPG